MDDQYGSDFITISDEEGNDYELEVLSSIEYNGNHYLAVTPADGEDDTNLEVSILKSETDTNGDPMLSTVDDEQELEAVYELLIDQMYEEEDTES